MLWLKESHLVNICLPKRKTKPGDCLSFGLLMIFFFKWREFFSKRRTTCQAYWPACQVFLQLQISSKWKTIYDILIWYIIWPGYSVLQKAGQSPIYISAHIQAHIGVTEGFNLSLSFSLIHFLHFFSRPLLSSLFLSSPHPSPPFPLSLLLTSFLLPPLSFSSLLYSSPLSSLLSFPPSLCFYFLLF